MQREREKRRLLSRGSSFRLVVVDVGLTRLIPTAVSSANRYSGKTQKQMQEFVRENFVKRQSFQR